MNRYQPSCEASDSFRSCRHHGSTTNFIRFSCSICAALRMTVEPQGSRSMSSRVASFKLGKSAQHRKWSMNKLRPVNLTEGNTTWSQQRVRTHVAETSSIFVVTHQQTTYFRRLHKRLSLRVISNIVYGTFLSEMHSLIGPTLAPGAPAISLNVRNHPFKIFWSTDKCHSLEPHALFSNLSGFLAPCGSSPAAMKHHDLLCTCPIADVGNEVGDSGLCGELSQLRCEGLPFSAKYSRNVWGWALIFTKNLIWQKRRLIWCNWWLVEILFAAGQRWPPDSIPKLLVVMSDLKFLKRNSQKSLGKRAVKSKHH